MCPDLAAAELQVDDLCAILGLVRDGVFVLDRDLVVRFFNEGAARLLGRTPVEVLGRPLFEAFPEAKGSVFEQKYRESIEGACPLSFEVYFDREPYENWYEVRTFPHRGGIVVAFEVTSERRRLDEKLRQAAKRESLDTMAGGIAHDFNNLLVGIIGNADLSLTQLPLGSDLRPLLEDVLVSANKAAELSRQMLQYAGRRRLLLRPLALDETIRRLKPLLQAAVGAQNRLVLELDGAPELRADGDQLQQLLVQLLTNAGEATSELDAGDGAAPIYLRAGAYRHAGGELPGAALHEELPAGDYAFIEVADEGGGIGTTQLARIFDPFYSTKFTGRGLGLATVLGTARAHGGAVCVESVEGKGTTMRVLLPLRAPKAKTARTKAHHRLRLLLIDDEESVRLAVERMLERLGFAVEVANDGADGLELFRKDPDRYVAVILDATMPRLDGPATLSALRALRRDVPVLLCSGYAQESVERRLGELRPDGFLRKPFRLRELRDALAPLVGLGAS